MQRSYPDSKLAQRGVVGLVILFIIEFGISLSFAHPVLDDFCVAVTVKTQNWITATYHSFLGFRGLFTSIGMGYLYNQTFDLLDGYYFSLLGIFVITAFAYIFSARLYARYIGSKQATILGLLLFALYLASVRVPSSMFHWQTAARSYQLGGATFIGLLALLIRYISRTKRPTPLAHITFGFAMFLSMGFAESVTILAFGVLTSVALVTWLINHPAKYLLLTTLIFAGLGTLIVVASPMFSGRLSSEDSARDWVNIIKIVVANGGSHLILGVACLATIQRILPFQKEINELRAGLSALFLSWQLPANLLIVATYSSLPFVAFFPQAVALGKAGPARSHTPLFALLIVGWLPFTISLSFLHKAIGKWAPPQWSVRNVPKWARLVLLLISAVFIYAIISYAMKVFWPWYMETWQESIVQLIMTIFITLHSARLLDLDTSAIESGPAFNVFSMACIVFLLAFSNVRYLSENFLNGRISNYNQVMTERFEILSEANRLGEKDVVVPFLQEDARPHYFVYVHDIKHASFYANQCLAGYIGVDSISTQ